MGKREVCVLSRHFRNVMDIYPVFKVSGGPGIKGTVGHMKRLKKWFYYGFNRRNNLSNRKISSVIQKFPKDWNTPLSSLIFDISFELQRHEVDFDGTTVMVPGIEDYNCVNFDHVHFWYVHVGNHLWGPKIRRRNFSTAGK